MPFDLMGVGRCCCPELCDCETRGCVCDFNWGFTSQDEVLGDLPANRFLGHYLALEDYFDSVEWSIMMWWENCAPIQQQSGTLFALFDPTRPVIGSGPFDNASTEILVSQLTDPPPGPGIFRIEARVQTYGNDLVRDDEFIIVLPDKFRATGENFTSYSDGSADTACKMLGISYRRSPSNPDYNFLNIYYNDQFQLNDPDPDGPNPRISREHFLEKDGNPDGPEDIADVVPLDAGALWRPGGGIAADGISSGSFMFNVGVARTSELDGLVRFNRLFDGCGSHLTIWKDFNTLDDWRAEFNNGLGIIPLAKKPFEHWCPTEPVICGTEDEDDRDLQIGDNGNVLHLVAFDRDEDCELILDENDQPILAVA